MTRLSGAAGERAIDVRFMRWAVNVIDVTL